MLFVWGSLFFFFQFFFFCVWVCFYFSLFFEIFIHICLFVWTCQSNARWAKHYFRTACLQCMYIVHKMHGTARPGSIRLGSLWMQSIKHDPVCLYLFCCMSLRARELSLFLLCCCCFFAIFLFWRVLFYIDIDIDRYFHFILLCV